MVKTSFADMQCYDKSHFAAKLQPVDVGAAMVSLL